MTMAYSMPASPIKMATVCRMRAMTTSTVTIFPMSVMWIRSEMTNRQFLEQFFGLSLKVVPGTGTSPSMLGGLFLGPMRKAKRKLLLKTQISHHWTAREKRSGCSRILPAIFLFGDSIKVMVMGLMLGDIPLIRILRNRTGFGCLASQSTASIGFVAQAIHLVLPTTRCSEGCTSILAQAMTRLSLNLMTSASMTTQAARPSS